MLRRKRHALIKQGVSIYACDHRIAKLPNAPAKKGQCCFCEKCFGTVVKPSIFYQDVWLLKFDDRRSYMCSTSVLKFVSKFSPNHKVVKGKDGATSVIEVKEGTKEECYHILKIILNSKIHIIIRYKDVTYNTLVSLFNQEYVVNIQ